MVLTPLTPTPLSGFSLTFPTLTIGSGTLTGRLTVGSGDEQQLFVPTTGQHIHALSGTSAAPDTSGNPLIKATRTVAIDPGVSETGNNTDRQPAVFGICYGVTGNKVQVTGIAGIAINSSTTADLRNDAVGVVGYGKITAAGSTNAATGAYFASQRTIASTFSGSMELQAQNLAFTGSQIFGTGTISSVDATANTLTWVAHGLIDGDLILFVSSGTIPGGLLNSADGTPHLYYVVGATTDTFQVSLTLGGSAVDITSTGSGTLTAYPHPGSAYTSVGSARVALISMSAGGIANGLMAGCGVQFYRSGTAVIDVGIGVPAMASDGDGRGPIRQAVLRDDGQSLYSILVKGSHATAAIAVDDGAGPVVIGDNQARLSGTLEVWNQTGGNNLFLVAIGDSNASGYYAQALVLHNKAGSQRLGIMGDSSAFGIGVRTHGDGIIQAVITGSKFYLASSNKPIVTWTNDSKLGFFDVTPIVQPTAYTQTYSTTSRTVSNPTAVTLTDSTAGTANTTLQALPDPADTPATADALRDDLVANLIPALRNNYADLAAQVNALVADVANVKQVQNSVIDDGQAYGFLQ